MNAVGELMLSTGIQALVYRNGGPTPAGSRAPYIRGGQSKPARLTAA